MHLKREYKSFDYTLALLVLALCVFGIIMVYSATFRSSKPVIASMYKSQIVWIASGFVIMLVMAFVDFEFIGKFYLVIYGFTLLLLVLVLVLGGDEDGVARWLYLKDFGIPGSLGKTGIQPSEFTKLFMIIYMAKIIDKYQKRVNEILVLFCILAAALIPIVLIAAQPSLSASLVPLVILITMLYLGKISYKYVVFAVLIVIPLLFLLYYDVNRATPFLLEWKILKGYQVNRLLDYFNFEASVETKEQTSLSIQALTSGKLFGRGLFNNVIAVPIAHNDFIFSIIGAEFGFAGCCAVVLTMFAIVAKCLLIAYKSAVFYGKLIAGSVGIMFAFQAFVNVSVATGILPNTGMAFPFISAGGSSMWISLASVGLVINVGMTKQKSMFDD